MTLSTSTQLNLKVSYLAPQGLKGWEVHQTMGFQVKELKTRLKLYKILLPLFNNILWNKNYINNHYNKLDINKNRQTSKFLSICKASKSVHFK